MSKHTPGPWWICVDDSGDRPVEVPSVQAPPELDCAIVHWDGFWQEYWQSARGHKEMLANARLIAAAPELLEAATHLLDVGEFCRTDDTESALRSLRAAIAKATGAA